MQYFCMGRFHILTNALKPYRKNPGVTISGTRKRAGKYRRIYRQTDI